MARLPEKLQFEYTERLNAVRTDRSALFSAIVCAALVILIVYSFIVRIQMYMLGITLWEDEARLAENIVDRTMLEMLTPPLVNLQTAPALYLIFVKTLTLVFGTSEAVLRAPSFVAMIGLLIAQGLLLRKVFNVRIMYTLFSVALSSIFLYYMQHSNELKPYIGDAMFVLCVLLGYYAFRQGYLGKGIRSAILLALVFIVCMLFSTPAAFIIGAVYIVEFLLKIRCRDKKAIRLIIISGLIFIAAFVLNYLLWLRPIAENPDMVHYWDGYKLDLSLTREALAHNLTLIRYVLAPIWRTVWITLPFAAAGFIISLAKRNIYTLVTGLFVLILLVASALDKYPLADRLWLFLYALIFIYCFVFINSLRIHFTEEIGRGLGGLYSGAKSERVKKIVRTIIPLMFSVILLAPNFTFPAFAKGEEWTLVPGDQAKPLIEHVRENIQEGEVLYSYVVANKILKYVNGYDSKRIGNVSSDNIIFGTEDYEGDVDKVVGAGNAYVLFYHAYYPLSKDWVVYYVIELFQDRGYMDLVMDVHSTPLYWFTMDINDVRAAAEIDVTDLQTSPGGISGTLTISNTGGTILARELYDSYGPLYIVLREAGAAVPDRGEIDGVVLGTVTTPFRQGEAAELAFEKEGLEPGSYQIDLVAIGEYYFSELGLVPIPVVIDR